MGAGIHGHMIWIYLWSILNNVGRTVTNLFQTSSQHMIHCWQQQQQTYKTACSWVDIQNSAHPTIYVPGSVLPLLFLLLLLVLFAGHFAASIIWRECDGFSSVGCCSLWWAAVQGWCSFAAGPTGWSVPGRQLESEYSFPICRYLVLTFYLCLKYFIYIRIYSESSIYPLYFYLFLVFVSISMCLLLCIYSLFLLRGYFVQICHKWMKRLIYGGVCSWHKIFVPKQVDSDADERPCRDDAPLLLDLLAEVYQVERWYLKAHVLCFWYLLCIFYWISILFSIYSVYLVCNFEFHKFPPSIIGVMIRVCSRWHRLGC